MAPKATSLASMAGHPPRYRMRFDVSGLKEVWIIGPICDRSQAVRLRPSRWARSSTTPMIWALMTEAVVNRRPGFRCDQQPVAVS